MPTILELFHSSGLKDSVKTDTETLVEQETSGIRIKSLVEINNPLIYGNEAGRISLRSTPDLEKQIYGGVYEETLTLIDTNIPDNSRALRSLSSDLTHKTMVRSQYD